MKQHLLASLFLLFLFSFVADAQQEPSLIDVLLKKNIISRQEADSLKNIYDSARVNQKSYTLNSSRMLQVSGYTQVRYQSFQADKNSGFDVRRARLDIKGDMTPEWEYHLQGEFAINPRLADGYVTYKPKDFLKITAGQFYIPLSIENNTPNNELITIDRSQVVTALAARDNDVIGNQDGRDIGVEVKGSFVKSHDRYIVDYYIGLFNGAGINVTADNNHSKDVGGRLIFHPFKSFDIGGSYYNGYDKWGTPLMNQNRKRSAGEASYHYKLFSLQGEYIQGEDGAINRAGWYAQAALFVWHKRMQVVAKYDTFDPNTASSSDKDISTYYIGGLNYLFNDWAKIQVNYSYRREQGQQVNNDLLSVQTQLSF